MHYALLITYVTASDRQWLKKLLFFDEAFDKMGKLVTDH